MFLMNFFVFYLFSASDESKLKELKEELTKLYVLSNESVGDKNKEENLKEQITNFCKKVNPDSIEDILFCGVLKKCFKIKLKAKKDEKFIIAIRELDEKVTERILEKFFTRENK